MDYRLDKIAQYLRGWLDEPVVMDSQGARYYHFDGLGSH